MYWENVGLKLHHIEYSIMVMKETLVKIDSLKKETKPHARCYDLSTSLCRTDMCQTQFLVEDISWPAQSSPECKELTPRKDHQKTNKNIPLNKGTVNALVELICNINAVFALRKSARSSSFSSKSLFMSTPPFQWSVSDFWFGTIAVCLFAGPSRTNLGLQNCTALNWQNLVTWNPKTCKRQHSRNLVGKGSAMLL